MFTSYIDFVRKFLPKSEHISENITELFKKVKKGSKPFRHVLNRDQDFISANKLKSWKKNTERC